jgi:hypothetical protein
MKRGALSLGAIALLGAVLALYADKQFVFDLANRWFMCF